MKLKAVYSISESDALADINPRKAPPGIPQALYSRGRGVHSQSLGWHRGRQAGIHSAYLTLQKAYPKAAAALIEAFGMDKDGVIQLL